MSQSIIHGLPSATLTPSHDFTLTRSTDGQYTATLTFRCTSTDFAQSSVLSQLKKGTSLGLLYTQLPPKFDFLTIDNWESSNMAGGYVEVRVFCGGQPDPSGSTGLDLDDENASVTYTRTTGIQQMSIFDHPQFKADLTEEDQALMREWADGLIMEDPSDTAEPYEMVYTKNDSSRGGFVGSAGTFSNVAKWAAIIITRKILTWETPVSEWTKAGSRKTLFTQGEVNSVGQAPVTPPLNPPAPNGQTWRYTGINEDINMVGVSTEQVSSNRYSQTWSSGFWDSDLFNHENFGPSA